MRTLARRSPVLALALLAASLIFLLMALSGCAPSRPPAAPQPALAAVLVRNASVFEITVLADPSLDVLAVLPVGAEAPIVAAPGSLVAARTDTTPTFWFPDQVVVAGQPVVFRNFR